MNSAIWLALLQSAASLLALAVVFDLSTSWLSKRKRPLHFLVSGALIGLLTILVMTAPLHVAGGARLDLRSVLLVTSGLFFGPGATVTAMATAAIYRVQLGGSVVVAGVLIILASGTIGMVWRHLRGSRQWTVREVYLAGFVVHVAMLASIYAFPGHVSRTALFGLVPPVLVVFPAATAAVGALLLRRRELDRRARALEESEHRHRSLFQNNSAVMLIIDTETRQIVDANPAAARFYGWSQEQLKRMAISDINTLTADEIRIEMTAAQAGERTFFRFRHRLASGEIRDVEVRSGEVRIDRRPYLHSVVHDATAERQAASALRLRGAALDAAANAILITDRDGRIEWVNKAYSLLYGYQQAEAVGRNPRDLMKSGVQDAAFYTELWRTLRSGQGWRGQLTNRRKDGSLIVIDTAITPLPGPAGETEHFIAVQQDLTAWQEMERKLSASQRLESVGRLAGGVAHDFNNLLTVVNGTLDLVLADLPPAHSLRSELEEVRAAGERATNLTRQLLAFGRRHPQRQEVLSLNQVISDMGRMLNRLIGDEYVLELELSSELPPVLADAAQLEQVVLNLVLNARDAMVGGGRIRMATGQDGECALLVVQDSGHGMDPATKARIFDPFFTTKAQGKGTGLGLATVYGVITQAGGSIDVDSQPGLGTTFKIRLPVASMSEAGPDAGAAGPEPTDNSGDEVVEVQQAVLVVEDEQAIQQLAKKVLTRRGFAVRTASTGSEALEMIARAPDQFWLLFSDIAMPGMNGLEVARRATAMKPDLRVLLTSGHTADSLEYRGVPLNGDSASFESTQFPYLEKPYTPACLMDAVARARRDLTGQPI